MIGTPLDCRHELARRLNRIPDDPGPAPQLQNGSRVAVIGGGPAGSFFAYFLLQLAEKLEFEIEVDIFEPRLFGHFGPAGCNHCGGIISESLVQLLAMDGIELPDTVIQGGIEAYVLHTEEGVVRIGTPLGEKRIASIYRGGGPKGLSDAEWKSFDKHLLELAQQKGARVRREIITDVQWRDDRPYLVTSGGANPSYDLTVVASGVNSHLLEKFEALRIGYTRPKTTTAFISEFHLGKEFVQQKLGTAMHVFLLNLPRLEFAALIPKSGFVTVCLLGEDIDEALVDAFLNSPEVKSCFPGIDGLVRKSSCHCFPRINIDGSPQPYANRLLFIGDSGVARLYKDGIGAAYRTAKAAATAAVLGGLCAAEFERHYMPACRRISSDNAIGKVVFWGCERMKGMGFTRRAMVNMTAFEQHHAGVPLDMSGILWDVFTGSAPYKDIFLRSMRPMFLARLARYVLAALWSTNEKNARMEEVK